MSARKGNKAQSGEKKGECPCLGGEGPASHQRREESDWGNVGGEKTTRCEEQKPLVAPGLGGTHRGRGTAKKGQPLFTSNVRGVDDHQE